MGYLTVALVRNDATSEIGNNPNEVTQALVEGMRNLGVKELHHDIGNYGNAIVTMPIQDVRDEMLYVLSGNTLTEVTSKTLAQHDWVRDAFKRVLKRVRT